MRKQYVLKGLGVLMCLIGAFLMWNGTIFGESASNIATVVGITGIGIISISKKGGMK